LFWAQFDRAGRRPEFRRRYASGRIANPASHKVRVLRIGAQRQKRCDQQDRAKQRLVIVNNRKIIVDRHTRRIVRVIE
jgi:hypothetical protein